jgi:hypothetical protein
MYPSIAPFGPSTCGDFVWARMASTFHRLVSIMRNQHLTRGQIFAQTAPITHQKNFCGQRDLLIPSPKQGVSIQAITSTTRQWKVYSQGPSKLAMRKPPAMGGSWGPTRLQGGWLPFHGCPQPSHSTVAQARYGKVTRSNHLSPAPYAADVEIPSLPTNSTCCWLRLPEADGGQVLPDLQVDNIFGAVAPVEIRDVLRR